MNEDHTISVSDLRDEMSEVVGSVQHTGIPTIIERHGKQVAALISLSDFHLLAEIERLIDLNEAEKELASVTEAEMTSLGDLKSELGLDD